jgi:hypothetical protein
MRILEVCLGVFEFLLYHNIVHIVHELFYIEFVVFNSISEGFLAEGFGRSWGRSGGKPITVIAGQETGGIIATGEHKGVVEIVKGDIAIRKKLCRCASCGCEEGLYGGGVGLNFQGIIEGEASVECVHFG